VGIAVQKSRKRNVLAMEATSCSGDSAELITIVPPIVPPSRWNAQATDYDQASSIMFISMIFWMPLATNTYRDLPAHRHVVAPVLRAFVPSREKTLSYTPQIVP
jgi:hypothetical protein